MVNCYLIIRLFFFLCVAVAPAINAISAISSVASRYTCHCICPGCVLQCDPCLKVCWAHLNLPCWLDQCTLHCTYQESSGATVSNRSVPVPVLGGIRVRVPAPVRRGKRARPSSPPARDPRLLPGLLRRLPVHRQLRGARHDGRIHGPARPRHQIPCRARPAD